MLVWIWSQWPSNGFVGFHDSGTDGLWEVVNVGCPQKKSVFPVQRVAKIVTSRAVAFFSKKNLGGGGGQILSIFWGKKNKTKKKLFLAKMKNEK